MSRLIDANNLNFEGQHYNKSQMKAILDFIDAQPTAYDVDKVIEQVEQERAWRCEDSKRALEYAIGYIRGGSVE